MGKNKLSYGLRGFTLIEIMFALSVFAVMMTMLYNALAVTIRGVKVIDRAFITPRRALALSRMFERELTGIYLPEEIKPAAPKKGDEKKPKIRRLKERMVFGLVGKSKEIHFTALVPFNTQDEPPIGDILEIGYEFDSGEKRIKKRYDPIPDEKIDKGGEETTLELPVSSLKFEYFDKKWKDSWDSRKTKKLPTGIRVTIEIELDEKELEMVSEEAEENLITKHQVVVLLPNAVDNKIF
ncbi:prepilin-type N-terminal cleavage/methylation domain-containing protein [bacterium]|jgi:type II secretion system protein J|nr:prepilin-type N-terminal cleavage/methylation domain-containing protein [bacterium]